MCKRFVFSFFPETYKFLPREREENNENYIFDLPINRSGILIKQ